MALSFLATMSVLVLEISRETLVEYSVASKKLHKVQSYYAARAGIELSLIRISIYSEIVSNYKQYLTDKKTLSFVNKIWDFDMSWPISSFLSEQDQQISQSLKNAIKGIEKKSFLKVKYYTKIHPQSLQIDVNNLGSPSQLLSSLTRKLILSLFEKEKKNNKKFNKKYLDVNFQELVNNMADWVDADNKGLNGVNESSYYDVGEGHNNQFMPPNQSFKSLSELHMVAGMKDDFYELLLPHITLSGEKGLNLNRNQNLNYLFHSQILDEEELELLTDQIKEEKGLLTEEKWKDFLNNIEKLEKFQDEPFILDSFAEDMFLISSTGDQKNVTSEIRVYTQNIEKNKVKLQKLLDLEHKRKIEELKGLPSSPPSSPSSETTNSNRNRQTNKMSSPTIVHWQEI